MNRLKFRAWDAEAKVMKAFDLYQTNHLPNYGYPVMQFTVLKDRNGVEIYESDIVNYHFVEDHLICTVPWNEDRCCFGFKDKGEDVIYGVNIRDVAERAEVIGNIFQNKELLE